MTVRIAAATPTLSALSSQPAASVTLSMLPTVAVNVVGNVNSKTFVPPTRTTDVAAVVPTVNSPAVMSVVSILLLSDGVNSTRTFSPDSSA